jgi:tetratricopeptide (TPR) repeat protein
MDMKTKLPFVVPLSVFLVIFSLTDSVSASDKEFEIGVTKGSYAIENGSYGEAQTYLKKALDINSSDPQALLLMGIALIRVENYAEAKGYLADALQQDPDSWRTKFELGVAHYHLGTWEEAGSLFREVDQSEADRHAKKVARKYLSRISGKEDKPYRVELYAGWQYDDNVILEPENPTFTGEDESDWRWLALFDSNLTLFQTDFFKTEIGYMFYHSFHDTLDEFDVEQHSLSFNGTYDPDGPFKVVLEYEFRYSEVDNQEYSNFHIIRPTLLFSYSPEYQIEKFQTEIHYTHEFLDFENFDNTVYSFFNSYRTGDNNAIGLTEKIQFNKQNMLSLDYTYNMKRADGIGFDGDEFWGYDGHKGTINFTSNINRWQLFLAASYFVKKYEEDYWLFVSPDTYRQDRVQEYSLAITWNPFNWLSISLTENYLINDSNIRDADYKRNIIGLVVGVGI